MLYFFEMCSQNTGKTSLGTKSHGAREMFTNLYVGLAARLRNLTAPWP